MPSGCGPVHRRCSRVSSTYNTGDAPTRSGWPKLSGIEDIGGAVDVQGVGNVGTKCVG